MHPITHFLFPSFPRSSPRSSPLFSSPLLFPRSCWSPCSSFDPHISHFAPVSFFVSSLLSSCPPILLSSSILLSSPLTPHPLLVQACAPHFIRCIKTNRASKANAFDGSYVLMQLRCSGMMEALELMQAGYPTRCPYKELATRYRPVMPPAVSRLSDALFVEAILEALEMERTKYKLGITRVFFRAGQLAFLERLTGQGDISSEEIVTRVTKWLHNRRKRMIRLGMLGMLVFTRMLRVIRLARMLQAATRILLPLQRWCNRATATRRSKAATAIQALVRGSLASRRWRAQRWGVLLLQVCA